MERGPRQFLLVLTLAALSILTVVSGTWLKGWSPLAIDYASFWYAARLPISSIYPTNAFVYPPTAISFLMPFRAVGFWHGYFIWTAASLITFFLAARSVAGTNAAAVSLLSAPVLSNLLVGQTPMILGAALLFGITLPSVGFGFVVGILTALKPQMFVMAPFILLVRRDWIAMASALVSGIASIGISIAIFGFGSWLAWASSLATWRQILINRRVFDATVTLAGQATRFGLPPLPWWLAGIAVALFACIKLARRLQDAELAALIICCSAMAAPYALPHDLVAAMPALAAAILSSASLIESAFGACFFAGILLPILLPVSAFVGARTGTFPLARTKPRTH